MRAPVGGVLLVKKQLDADDCFDASDCEQRPADHSANRYADVYLQPRLSSFLWHGTFLLFSPFIQTTPSIATWATEAALLHEH